MGPDVVEFLVASFERLPVIASSMYITLVDLRSRLYLRFVANNGYFRGSKVGFMYRHNVQYRCANSFSSKI